MPVHVLNAGQLMSVSVATELEELAVKTLAEVSQELGLEPVDVVICDYPGLAISELAVGGYAPGPNTAFVAIEPDNPAFEQWRVNVPMSMAHELHHARRWQGPGYGPTLLDSLVSEGTATLYEAERSGRLPIYAAPPADLDELWHLAKPHLAATGLHAEWFFGAGVQPRWAGYALGYELARRHCAATAITSAAAAIVPSGEFVHSWR